jgi:hypothetical protein
MPGMRGIVAKALCTGTLLLALAPAAAHAQSPVSSHAMLYTCCSTQALKERAFAESKALGASYIRVDVELGPMFNSDGQPDWRGLDSITALSRRYQLPVLGILMDTPGYLSSCPGPKAGFCAPSDMSRYGQLVRQVAAHAGAGISHWEILNEPDSRESFLGSPEQYARMLATAHDAVKAVAPADQVVIGGVSAPNDRHWIDRVFATPGADAAHKFDVANMHLRGRLVDLPTGVARWRSVMASHGFGGPLWVTEHGYSADTAYQQDPGYRGGATPQAAYLKRSLLALTEAGAQQVFVTLRDNSELQPNYVHEGIEAIGDDGQVARRPAFAAVQDFAQRWPEIHALRVAQRAHEQRASELVRLAAAADVGLSRVQASRGRVQAKLAATQSALVAASRAVKRAHRRAGALKRLRAKLKLARRRIPRYTRLLRRYDLRIRDLGQQASGDRLAAMQHVFAALDCARRVASS